MGVRAGSVSAWVAGFLAVLISYAGPLLIFIQAAHVGHIPPDMLASWIWAISIGAGVSGLLLSWWLKIPVITAWSAPGTALLITLFPEISMAQVVGAYILAALLVLLVGVTGYFDKLVRAIPRGIAAGMMAGILFQFGTQAFAAAGRMPALVFAMLGAYFVCRRLCPRYTVVAVALTGFAMALVQQLTDFSGLALSWTQPIFVMPQFDWVSFFSLALPLTIVSLTGQFLPGMAVMQLSGYQMPARPVIMVTGLASFATAFFGGVTIVLSAITAALCTGKDAHPEKDKRYIAGIANGVFYLVGGTFAGTIVLLFKAVPAELVAILAGLALIGAIVSNMTLVVEDAAHREASTITFLATASGMALWGFGSAFWGIVIGMLAHGLMSWRKHANA
ncbi:benzoate membrane transport protein [Kerstersia gyiorum]|uniref:Benzoate membrane transport protein n=1 Tax=Kerstersia gyiorum TaxID=206506 RepID=A0A4Q7MNP8_9BURK|nr:benzoate/H(+) symporter BenE family transporter [Kerstersia gyiorum]KAB0543668.1 benzoate/H(+) symporter BenE family transporter [Kerstersia gyiorum]RZS70079.1 benzoate membrane transport protein [Kerstersia gyiorum]